MVETGGQASSEGKSRQQNPVTLRFNVADIEAAAAMLRARGVGVQVRHRRRITGDFLDPDGNRCELRDHTTEFIASAG
jgi:lactoylglutathione lyase